MICEMLLHHIHSCPDVSTLGAQAVVKDCVWWGFGWECAVDLEFEFHLAKHPKIWAVLEWHMLYMSLVASNV